jgi:hypothetical protein
MQLKTMLQTVALAAVSLAIVQPPASLAQARGTATPQRGQRATTAKPPAPLTLRQVIESLSASRNSTRAENLVSRAGVQFKATPEVLDILKQFGASPKLIAMIPAPPPPPRPPEPPAPKVAGPLTVVCEPADCLVVVGEKYEGATNQSRKTVSGLRPGETTIQVFLEGYEPLERRVVLDEGRAVEEKFSLKRSALVRDKTGRAAVLRTLAALGGVDGFVDLADFEGNGTMQWTNSAGMAELWPVTFNKRAGKNLTMTFKIPDGQCTASLMGQTAKQECRGGLKNGGDKIAEQGTSLFMSYQLQDVIDALLLRPLMASETDDNRVESIDAKDSYVLTIGKDGLPTDLVYRIGDAAAPIHVQYSNYLNLNKGRYPGRISVGRLNSAPAWIFTLNSVRSRVTRAQ